MGGGGGGGGYANMGTYGNQAGGDYGPQRNNYTQNNRYSGPYGGNYIFRFMKMLNVFLDINVKSCILLCIIKL